MAPTLSHGVLSRMMAFGRAKTKVVLHLLLPPGDSCQSVAGRSYFGGLRAVPRFLLAQLAPRP